MNLPDLLEKLEAALAKYKEAEDDHPEMLLRGMGQLLGRARSEFTALSRNSMPTLLAELKRLARVEAAAKDLATAMQKVHRGCDTPDWIDSDSGSHAVECGKCDECRVTIALMKWNAATISTSKLEEGPPP